MRTPRPRSLTGTSALLCAALAASGLPVVAQSTLPATSPTSTMAPISGLATPDTTRLPRHHAEVTCQAGQIEIHADNSSLNGILRSISTCTGMKITGGVVDQRVFGKYGPAPASTVIATLLDGTGTNMLLLQTASNAPAELILTPRTGGPTPPSPNQLADADIDVPNPVAQPQPNPNQLVNGNRANQPGPQGVATGQAQPGGTAPGGQGSYPPSMPPPNNNVMGSPTNTSPTASTYPTTNSVPLDSLPTPYTTPKPSGIVDAPNPPAPGSDTARMMKAGDTTNQPGTTDMIDAPTSNATAPGATNTSTPTAGQSATPSGDGSLTPEQVYQQLRQMQQQKQQGQSPTTPTPPANQTSPTTQPQ